MNEDRKPQTKLDVINQSTQLKRRGSVATRTIGAHVGRVMINVSSRGQRIINILNRPGRIGLI